MELLKRIIDDDFGLIVSVITIILIILLLIVLGIYGLDNAERATNPIQYHITKGSSQIVLKVSSKRSMVDDMLFELQNNRDLKVLHREWEIIIPFEQNVSIVSKTGLNRHNSSIFGDGSLDSQIEYWVINLEILK